MWTLYIVLIFIIFYYLYLYILFSQSVFSHVHSNIYSVNILYYYITNIYFLYSDLWSTLSCILCMKSAK